MFGDPPQEPLYNQQTMGFLADQLGKALALGVPAGALPEQMAVYNKHVDKGKRLLAKHAEHFDIRDFYWTEDAYKAVETICGTLKEIMWGTWRMAGAAQIEERIPKESVEEDGQVLHSLLNYLLRNVQFDARGVLAQHLDAIKTRHKENMKLVRIVEEVTLQLGEQLGEGSQSVVYKALWMSTRVAVKQSVKVTVSGNMAIEELAEFLREVVTHAALNGNTHIVQLLAATPSGWIVLELADFDLHKLCHTTKGLPWATKVRLLREAAAGLAFMHSQKRVHGDVKPRNFLIFGTSPERCHLKISDFGLSFEARKSRSKTVRMGGGTPQWVAPELYHGKPINRGSDVYSFGVVCHELVTQMQPFGGETTNQFAIMTKKLRGEPPCPVAPNSCPPGMLALMTQCCALEPAERPTMGEVHSILLQIPENWEPSAN